MCFHTAGVKFLSEIQTPFSALQKKSIPSEADGKSEPEIIGQGASGCSRSNCRHCWN
jgi:hypothetical protein